MTLPILPLGPGCTPLLDTIYPDGTIESTDWTANPHTDTNDQSDATFASSASSTAVCPSEDAYDFEVSMDNPSGTVGAGDCQDMVVRVRARKSEIAGTGEVDIQFRLMEGATQRDISSKYNDIGTSFVTFTSVLSVAEVDAITNHNDLRVEVTSFGCGDFLFDSVECDVSQVEVEYRAR